jgi:copper(I)-binding protein
MAGSGPLALVAAALLLAGCGRGPAAGGASADAPGVRVTRAVAWGAPGVTGGSAGFEVTLTAPDTLAGVSVAAGRAEVHASKREGRHGMFPTGPLPLPSGRTMLDGEAYHVMLLDLPAVLAAGDTVRLELRFARAGAVTLSVPVLRYSDALATLGR